MENRRPLSKFFLYVPACICIPALILLLTFPIRTSATLWKQYRILTVSPSKTEADVVSRLAAAGANDIVTQSNALLPRGNRFSPVQPFIDEVNQQRREWFVHQESDTRFFFLPDEPELENRIRKALSTLPIQWYLENADSFYRYFFLPLLFLLAAGLFLQKNRALTFITAIPIFILVYSWNSPAGMVSSGIILATIIVISDLLYTGTFEITPQQLLRRAAGNAILCMPLLLSLFIAIFSGFRAVVLLLSALSCTVSLGIIFHLLPAKFRHLNTRSKHRFHEPFRIVPMHPETLYRQRFFRTKLFFILTGTLLVSSGMATIAFVTGGTEKTFRGNGQLYLPCPSGYTQRTGFSAEAFEEFIQLDRSNSLPDLADFLVVQWKIAVFPWKDYRDCLEPPSLGEKMIVEDYLFDEEQGRLAAHPRVVAVFDHDFIKETLSVKATPLEKMLVDQGRFVSGRITGHPE